MTVLAINATVSSSKLYRLGLAGESYATVHDDTVGAAGGVATVTEIGQDYTASTNKYNVRRGGLIFDTSAVPTGASIISAVLSLYGWAKDVDVDFSITVVSGADLATPLVDEDYGDLLNDTTSFGSMLASAFAVSSAENQITLNATGRAAITKGGVTRFGLRSSRDISNTAPTDGVFEYIQFLSPYGATLPKLTVTYGRVYPVDAITRVTNLVHRYDARKAIYQIEASFGDITSVLSLPYELTPRRATAEKQQEQETAPVVEAATKKATDTVQAAGGAMLTKYAKNVLKKAGLYYPILEKQRAKEPAAPTARTLQILEEREQDVQKLEKRIAEARGAMAITERAKRVVRESPEAQVKIEQARKKRWSFGDFFKLR